MGRGRIVVCVFMMALCILSAQAEAAVDLMFRPAYKALRVGDQLELGLYAASNNGMNQKMSAMDVVILYDHAKIGFSNFYPDGAPYHWKMEGFLSPSPDNINLSLDDGNMRYTAWAQLGIPAIATPRGLLVTMFEFFAVEPAARTTIDIPLNYGNVMTRVFDGTVPNTIINGAFRPAKIMIVPADYLISVVEAKAKDDEQSFNIGGPIVTRVYDDFFYLEDYDRTSGIRVNYSGKMPFEGTTPIINGTIRTVDGERVIIANSVSAGEPMTIPQPLAMNGKTPNIGLSPVGLLVRIASRVTNSETGSFTLCDGYAQGVNVLTYGIDSPANGSFMAVTGALGKDSNGNPVLHVNSSADIAPCQ